MLDQALDLRIRRKLAEVMNRRNLPFQKPESTTLSSIYFENKK